MKLNAKIRRFNECPLCEKSPSSSRLLRKNEPLTANDTPSSFPIWWSLTPPCWIAYFDGLFAIFALSSPTSTTVPRHTSHLLDNIICPSGFLLSIPHNPQLINDILKIHPIKWRLGTNIVAGQQSHIKRQYILNKQKKKKKNEKRQNVFCRSHTSWFCVEHRCVVGKSKFMCDCMCVYYFFLVTPHCPRFDSV